MPYPDLLRIAHRGWHRDHAENTLDAFRSAYSAGCDMVEFDVQLSKDGVPVIFHDDDCRRLAGVDAKVHELDWDSLQRLALAPPGMRKGTGPASYSIPSLDQFLSEFGSKPFYLELKVPHSKAGDQGYWRMLGEKCSAKVKAAGPHPLTFLASFHGPILAHLDRDGHFPRLVRIFEDWSSFQEETVGAGQGKGKAFAGYSLSFDVYQRYAEAAAEGHGPKAKPGRDRSDRDFLIWGVKGKEDMRFAAERGVLALVADDVETLVSL